MKISNPSKWSILKWYINNQLLVRNPLALIPWCTVALMQLICGIVWVSWKPRFYCYHTWESYVPLSWGGLVIPKGTARHTCALLKMQPLQPFRSSDNPKTHKKICFQLQSCSMKAFWLFFSLNFQSRLSPQSTLGKRKPQKTEKVRLWRSSAWSTSEKRVSEKSQKELKFCANYSHNIYYFSVPAILQFWFQRLIFSKIQHALKKYLCNLCIVQKLVVIIFRIW